MIIPIYVFAVLLKFCIGSETWDDDLQLNVVQLTTNNFDKHVIQDDRMWIIIFLTLDCSDCKSSLDEVSKVAAALKGIIRVGMVYSDVETKLKDKYSVRQVPAVYIFMDNKKRPQRFTRTLDANNLAKHVISIVTNKVKDIVKEDTYQTPQFDEGLVIELTDDNFKETVLDSTDAWMVEFYAPWCGHCQNFAPEYREAALKLKGKAKLAAIDATKYTKFAHKYGVQGYPSVRYFPAGTKRDKDYVEYRGGRLAENVVDWVLDRLQAEIKPPAVSEIINVGLFEQECSGRMLCIIAFLPHILDCQSACRNQYLDILKQLGKEFKSKNWGWVWSEANAQPELESTLGIGGFGYPALAVLNPKKMIYSTFRGSFAKKSIRDFLENISSLKTPTSKLKNSELPEIGIVDPWDGLDKSLDLDEDLADIINSKDEF